MTNVVFYSQRLCAAIPWAVKHRGQGIHGTPEAAEELETVLTPAQLARLVSLFLLFSYVWTISMTCFFLKQDPAGNVPAQLMTEITRALDRMNEHKVELIYQLLMDNDLTALHAFAAKTDRIAQVSAEPFRFFPLFELASPS